MSSHPSTDSQFYWYCTAGGMTAVHTRENRKDELKSKSLTALRQRLLWSALESDSPVREPKDRAMVISSFYK